MSEPPDPTEAVRQLAGALAAADRVPRVPTPSHEGVGRDRTGVVTAVVDADLRLASLSVASAWRQKIDPSQLVLALMTAIRQAGNSTLPPDIADASVVGDKQSRDEARRRVFEEAEARAGRAPDPLPPGDDPAYADQAAAQVTAFREAFATVRVPEYAEVATQLGPLMSLLEEAMGTLRDVAAGGYRAVAATVVSSPNLRVHFTYRGGLPVHIDIDRNWLMQQSGTTLTETFADIIERRRAGDVEPVVDDDRIEAAVGQTFLGQSPQLMALLGFGVRDGEEGRR